MSKGESFVASDFWSLPLEGFTGNINGNTKCGFGEMYDGIHNGYPVAPPENDIGAYLTDGIKGLNIGTCVANLPAGTMNFLTMNIRPTAIGDGIPDIIVTQVADPSGSTDKYSFRDNNGNIIGIKKNVVFTSISPVANWTADFYEANSRPMILNVGYPNTDRPMRLWAADLSDFGITAENYSSIERFTIELSGQSDVAFAAYINLTFNITAALPVKLSDFSGKEINNNAVLNWKTETEINSAHFVVEKSRDNVNFAAIATIEASNTSSIAKYYSATDKNLSEGTQYYRLQMVDIDRKKEYSKPIQIKSSYKKMSLSLYPNPAVEKVTVNYPASKGQLLQIFSAGGKLVLQQLISENSTQSTIRIAGIAKGIYYMVWQDQNDRMSQSSVIN